MLTYLNKDLRMMKNQAGFFMLIIFMSAVLTKSNDSPFFAVPYLVFITSLSVITAISYDEAENGYSFLFTLPISRKEYVKGKYMLTLFLTVLSAIVAYVILVGFLAAQHQLKTAGEYFLMTASFILLMLVYQSVILPLIFKCGVEKGRIIICAVTMAFGGIVIAVIKLVPDYADKLERIKRALENMEKLPMFGLGAAICILALFVSNLLSVRIMEKKEF